MTRQKGRLDGLGKVSELSAAKAAAESIRESANWIKANGTAFNEAAILEADVAMLAVALKAVDADKYAQGSLSSCMAAQMTARRLRDTGDFTGARDKFAEVKDLSNQTLKEASEAKRQAEEAAQAESFYARGNDFYSGRNGCRQDYAEAVRWYQMAAERGNAEAQGSLGWMYERGHGVPKDDAEAVRWYHKAAEQGNAVAQHFLGRMYEEGRGVSKDDSEAVRWYRKAAEQGNAEAQGCLGWMYERGRGVPKDDAEAAKWYRMAVEEGKEEARKALRRLGAK